jgi:hypothetical protein
LQSIQYLERLFFAEAALAPIRLGGLRICRLVALFRVGGAWLLVLLRLLLVLGLGCGWFGPAAGSAARLLRPSVAAVAPGPSSRQAPSFLILQPFHQHPNS